MDVELRLQGRAYRVVASLFSDCEISHDGDTTLVRATAVDEAAAVVLFERARSYGLTVLSWRRLAEG